MSAEAIVPDMVWPGEEPVEARWVEQKGVDPETGKAWLTPRMERCAERLCEQWRKMAEKQGEAGTAGE